ncbi:hypothetical protein [Pseudactinotalea sp.]|uniref:hypothetical protein n=1 Tax=Pseudactinotalea sp. TaxID=1926260 RepID=UPI003B3B05FD
MLVNGVPWFDDRGQVVNAHGVCVLEHEGMYYLYGEHKGDDVNEFQGFACYSSADLETWTFERMALPVQPEGRLGPNRVGERPKVLRCPSTGLFMMYMHTDDRSYTDPCTGVAISETPTGEFRFLGPLEYQGAPLRRWDIGSFHDADGTGYLLVHEGDIYRLSSDFHALAEKVCEGVAPGGESPALWFAEGMYYLAFSNKTSWERNDNYYLTAPAIEGPWTHRGLLAPEGALTFNSQCSFVLRVNHDGVPRHVYMGDRWSFPRQRSAASQVWLPIGAPDGGPPLREYLQAWRPATGESIQITGDRLAVDFSSAQVGESVEIAFTGTRIALIGRAHPAGGYARVEVAGEAPLETHVDFYAKVAEDGVRFVTPVLPHGDHLLRVSVTGEIPQWSDKQRSRYGSTGSDVTLSAAIVLTS